MKKEPKNKNLSPETVCGGEDGVAIRELMTRVGDKWSILLMVALSKMPKQRARFSEIDRTIPGITQRMLTLSLRNLERDGMVTREVFPQVPPRVEYELTDLGRSLLGPMQGLVDWVGNHWGDVKKARKKFDER
jgi:DNA-binding HxlR family transcriptional regulator